MSAASASVDEFVDGVRAADYQVLARAITLVESNRPADAKLAQELLRRLHPHTGGAQRIGVSGVPGVGKSTFIDALGSRLVEQGQRVAVLAVDPSSSISGGSILGDKTQMARLAGLDGAYIRPSPSARSLGGVGRRTRETMMLCEAAGFDIVLVETVGVGQSETMVANMVDCFLVLMLPGGGDELQGIKKGILEHADLIVVNKADGDNVARARESMGEYSAALRYARSDGAWKARSLMISALTGEGIDELWDLVLEHRAALVADGELERKRMQQGLSWMWALIEERLLLSFRDHPGVAERLPRLERQVLEGELPASAAATELLAMIEADSDSQA